MTPYLEIFKSGKLSKRGDEILSSLSWSIGLMETPQLDMTLPIDYLEYLSGREEIKIYANGKIFWGVVDDIEVDKNEETIDLSITHIVREWEYRQISVNNAVKDKAVNIIFKQDKDGKPETEGTVQDQLQTIYNDTNFAYPGWTMNYMGGAGSRQIDYVYSRQNKLEALTKTCELTPDLFWRVDFSGEKRIDVGTFGDIKPYILSKKPRGETNIQLLKEPTIDYDYENVFNIATVYTEKGDSGMSSTTLREVYNRPSLQVSGFPVVILRANVNNERDYSMYTTKYPKLAPNTELEYSILDEESIALEGGIVIEETFSANDIAPFNTDNDNSKKNVVTDADRIRASSTAYEAGIRKLKQARRSYKIEVVTEELPPTILVGDKVRLLYDNQILKLEACSSYMKKIMTMDDYYYITKIGYDIRENGFEVDTLTLEKQIKVDRETKDI